MWNLDSKYPFKVHFVLLPTVVLKPAQKPVQTYREQGTLLCSSGFQITFLGASELCSHESEAGGKEEENRGGRKLSRWVGAFYSRSIRAALPSSVW